MSMKHEKGIVLAEIVVGAAIIAASFVAIIGVYSTLTKYSFQTLPRIQAAMLAEESLEAVRSMRDESYSLKVGSLSSNATYYLYWSSTASSFSATTAASTIDSTFTRTLTFTPAYRDGSYNLASTGTADADTKLVTATVTWLQGSTTKSYVLKTYVSDIFNN